MEFNYAINLSLYNDKDVKFHQCTSVNEVLAKMDRHYKMWIHFNTVVDVDSIRAVFGALAIPEALIPDLIDTARFELHETMGNIFFVKFLVKHDSSARSDVKDEHVSFIVGEDFIITVEEKGLGLFQSVTDRMRTSKSNAIGKSVGFLFYKMLKVCVIDRYFDFFVKFNELHEKAEEEVLSRYSKRTLARILNLRKQILPFREYLIELDNVNDILLAEDTPVLDLEDQQSIKESVFRRVIDLKETLTDLRRWNTELMDIYRANVNEKMERVMRTLTIFSSIFLPLTFITGFYGMNFGYIPLLDFQYGYLAVSAIMLIIAVAMLLFMKRKKWY